MIKQVHGDLLRDDAEALVNTVNTVGVMGKGIALQFKKAFPKNYSAYRKACQAGDVVLGKMFVYQTGQVAGPRLIINFPTKGHWRSRTKMDDVRTGLIDLVRVIQEYDLRSIAVPPLGCGNGGLNWADVRPLIEDALAPLQDVQVLLHAPEGAPDPRSQLIATKRPTMTLARAVTLAALDSYAADPTANFTRLVAQKLSYLLEADGEPLNLQFAKGPYGPYSERMQHVLQNIDGHFIRGAGDRTGPTEMELVPDAVEQAWTRLSEADGRDSKARVDRVNELTDGFASPLGLELLTTVHWAAVEDGAATPSEALDVVGSWTERKQRTFRERHVAAAWQRLDDEGWIDAARLASGQ